MQSTTYTYFYLTPLTKRLHELMKLTNGNVEAVMTMMLMETPSPNNASFFKEKNSEAPPVKKSFLNTSFKFS